jgi:hypothetical protein
MTASIHRLTSGGDHERDLADRIVGSAIANHPRPFKLAVAMLCASGNAIAHIRNHDIAAEILRERATKHVFRGAGLPSRWGTRR